MAANGPAEWLRADLHSHTRWSPDSALSPRKIIDTCVRRGITCLAVTDHNEIDGAFAVAERAPFRVIVGEEVRTVEGEIIGLFLRERIPPYLSPEETVAAIREQGGIVVVPHPFDRLRGSRLRFSALQRLVDQIDVIEVYNSRIHWSADRLKADAFAALHGLAVSAGSDAHTALELGGSWVDLPSFSGPEDFLAALRRGRLHGKVANPIVHVITKFTKYRKKVTTRLSASRRATA